MSSSSAVPPSRDAVGLVLKSLASLLQSLPDLAAFTLTDRPTDPFAQPSIRFGPVRQSAWHTASSYGAHVDLTLTLASQTGSFAHIQTASDAITRALQAPLNLTDATCVRNEVSAARFAFEPSQDLELATLSVSLLIDFDQPS